MLLVKEILGIGSWTLTTTTKTTQIETTQKAGAIMGVGGVGDSAFDITYPTKAYNKSVLFINRNSNYWYKWI